MRFTVNSRATLHEPVEVEVDGVVLRVKPQTLKTLRKIQKLWAGMAAGSAEAIADALDTLFDGEVAVLEDLPMAQLKEVIEYAIEKSTQPVPDGKNSSGPGENT